MEIWMTTNQEGTVHVIHAMQPGGSLRKRIPKCNIRVEGKPVVALIDKGASINIMALQVIKTLQLKPILRTTTTGVFAFESSTPLPLTGVFRTDITRKGQTISTNVYVTKNGAGMLLSCRRAEKLGLVSFAFSVHQESIKGLIAEHSQLFQGIGCLKQRLIHLHIDLSIQPLALNIGGLHFTCALRWRRSCENWKQLAYLSEWRAHAPGLANCGHTEA
ncbi:hypothetical protein NDU88_003678 [Pleurodeles waltl]|uniref:Uncharacterized protein n=1 Tax=Pleurodeles waltl TaxID=8319 RepID=A0AAV7W6X3_PLEWA|nr:hypothetical protein NDU88_003678 [Pleurodeles waltl]